MPFENDGVSHVLHALRFASERHRDQRRKGGEASPYINHLIDVADILWSVGDVRDITTIVAAILHDTIEDTDTTREELTDSFGEEVTSVVLEITDDKELPNVVRKRLQVEHAAELSSRAAMIKIADKTSNIKDIICSPPVGWSLERRREYVAWGKEVVARIRGTNPALEKNFDRICEKAAEGFSAEEKEYNS